MPLLDGPERFPCIPGFEGGAGGIGAGGGGRGGGDEYVSHCRVTCLYTPHVNDERRWIFKYKSSEMSATLPILPGLKNLGLGQMGTAPRW